MHFFISKKKKKEPPAVCVTCNTLITIKHILIECADSVEVRKKYFEERSFCSLFKNVNLENIADCLRETGMFYRI